MFEIPMIYLQEGININEKDKKPKFTHRKYQSKEISVMFLILHSKYGEHNNYLSKSSDDIQLVMMKITTTIPQSRSTCYILHIIPYLQASLSSCY